MQKERARFWTVVILVLGILLMGYLAFLYYTKEPEPIAEETLEAREARELREEELRVPTEVLSPKVERLEDIATLTSDKPIPQPSTKRKVAANDDEEHIRGNPDAPFSLIEYTSYTNDYAGLMHPAIDALVNEYSNDLNWIFRHMLTGDGLPVESAQVAECVYLQKGDEGFWAYTDALMDRQSMFNQAMIYNAAEAVGADRNQIDACVRNNTTLYAVVRDGQDAAFDARLTIAPSFILRNNATGEIRVMEGINPPVYYEQVLQAMMEAN